jgi:hypothetical protein
VAIEQAVDERQVHGPAQSREIPAAPQR